MIFTVNAHDLDHMILWFHVQIPRVCVCVCTGVCMQHVHSRVLWPDPSNPAGSGKYPVML